MRPPFPSREDLAMISPKSVTKLAHGSVGVAFSVVRHPIGSAAMATGLVKGVAEAGIDLLRGGSAAQDSALREEAPETAPSTGPEVDDTSATVAQTSAPHRPREPQVVPKPVPDIDELPEPIVIVADDEHEAGEAFHTEPKAASRASAHGGSAGDREEADGYLEEIPDPLEDADAVPVWTSESSDEVDLAPAGEAKAVLSEARIMSKAADPHVE